MRQKNPLTLLVVRNDKLGDFMLVWPALALLKQNLDSVHITALTPSYTAPMADLCPWIDDVILDEPDKGALWLSGQFRLGRFDAMITYFSTGRVAIGGCLAPIPYRLAPASKLAQLCYNHRLKQRRSRSEKPEYAYNIDLSLQFLADHNTCAYNATKEADGDFLPKQLERPFLGFEDDAYQLKSSFCNSLGLEPTSRLIFIHPGSGGSANNLSPEQYAELANAIDCPDCAYVVTAGPGELAVAEEVTKGIKGPAVVFTSTKGLVDFARVLQLADIFISGSTGPLHIAGALDRPTAAFYPRHRSATPLRWQTLNAPDKRLAFVPPAEAEADGVSSIDVVSAAQQIREKFLR